MMLETATRYRRTSSGARLPSRASSATIRNGESLDRVGSGWPSRIAWGVAWTLVYLWLATAWWQLLLLPLHWLMGPVHGAIVNWCGHRYGYRNFRTRDESRNFLPFDFFTLGELFQNNHHRASSRPNFAGRWFEFDPTYAVLRVLAVDGRDPLSRRRARSRSRLRRALSDRSARRG